jgi:hypothetical protein
MNFTLIYNKINIKELETDFINTYYQNMFNQGFSANLGLFDEKAQCLVNDQEFTGAYNILVKQAQNNIYRFQYKSHHGNLQQTSNGFIISVSGICQPINFQNLYINEYNFSEVFYLSSQYPYKIVNYIARFY